MREQARVVRQTAPLGNPKRRKPSIPNNIVAIAILADDKSQPSRVEAYIASNGSLTADVQTREKV